MSHGRSNPPPARDESWPSRRRRWVAAAILLIVFGGAMWISRSYLQLSVLVQYETALRQLLQEHPVAVYCVALVCYITVTGLSIPAATGLSLLYAWYFGFWRALAVVSFGSTAGATVAFLMSRFFLAEFVQRRFGEQLARFQAAWERDGAYYVLTLRLLPVVPFFVVNAVLSLTPIRVRTFWWASQLGMLPGTIVYVYAGSTAPDLRTLSERGIGALPFGRIAIALTLLGLLPLATRWLLARLRR